MRLCLRGDGSSRRPAATLAERRQQQWLQPRREGEGRQGDEAGATATTVLVVLAWLLVVELGDVRCASPPKPREATGNIVEKLRWHGSIIRDCSWHHYLPTLVRSL
ncbi:hypothetical protein GUJ93_ZPchr0003g16595 [Zizania palustris]|uniref:Uncharacterized protein n=1 Tax=Zizania palustris TaxID=103762 RepID=A0A8J5VX25_ZIZPA|nr:hypothetical protein GUJ93_ZPchr0003g16595 [Zizania palustris]